jgi:hypothetical protein
MYKCKKNATDLLSMASRILKEGDFDEDGGVIRWKEQTDEEVKR